MPHIRHSKHRQPFAKSLDGKRRRATRRAAIACKAIWLRVN